MTVQLDWLFFVSLVLVGIGLYHRHTTRKPRQRFVSCKKMPLCQRIDGHAGECARSWYPDQC